MPAPETTGDDAQAEVTAFLSGAGAYGADTLPEIIETHVSRVFLAGERAFKMKRQVAFPYLDFSTLEKRRRACIDEVVVNRRTAPELYLGIQPVVRAANGGLALGGLEADPSVDDAGDDAALEWLVVMRQFDQEGLFDRLARDGALGRRRMEAVADAVAAFHAIAEPKPGRGGAAGTRLIVENNAESFALAPVGVFAPGAADEYNARALGLADTLAAALDARRDAGVVRHCHGDLHLRNICLLDGRPTLFDGIEFNRDFSDIDTLYDLAFLLMDLDFRDLRRLASIIFNRYFDITGALVETPSALAVLGLFLSMRAAVRAHVDAVQSGNLSDPVQRAKRAGEAGRYLALAGDYLEAQPPLLVAVGGLSGSGKSRMSRELAPYLGAAPGARVVRTDVVRKRLMGVAPETRLPEEAYSGDMHAKTYEAFYAEIRAGLDQGHAVIADGVFSSPHQRNAVRRFAADTGVPFRGIWMSAAPEVMERRVVERQHNASDATAEVLRQQLQYDLGEINWTMIDSGGEKAQTLAAGVAAVR